VEKNIEWRTVVLIAHQRLHRVADFIINATPMQRTAFLTILITAVSIQYGLWALVMLDWPYAHQFIDPVVIGRYLPFGMILIIISMISYLLCRAMEHCRSTRWHFIIQVSVAIFYTLNMLFFGYLIGSLSMAAGAVLMGSPIFGFFLLDRKAIYVGLAIGLLTIIASCLLSVYGFIHYAPLLIYQGDISTTAFWFWSMMFFILPYWLVVCVLCDFIIKNWRQREADIRYLAEHDPLTGLHNRHYLDLQIPLLLKDVILHQQMLSIVILDLDHFKKINDQFGHLWGDEVLQAAAQVLKQNIRKADIVGRFGGEEFILVLPNTDEIEALSIAEQIRHQLESLTLYDDQGRTIPVSGSLGLVTQKPIAQNAFNSLVHLADLALYEAKAHGRNQVRIYQGCTDVEIQ
jgi:diguanylate cyclase (GGDEF)-like protein